MGGSGIDRYIKEQCQKQKHATNYKQLDQCMDQFNPVRQNKNKHSAVCLKILVCLLLASNHMIFFEQFGINKYLQIFQRPQIALALRACAILSVFEKFTLAYLFQIALEIMLLPIRIKETLLLQPYGLV